jgi:hypothetical protein
VSEVEIHEDSADDMDRDCFICGGEGFLWGEDMCDPLWYDDDEQVRCYSCRGSGLREDMTVM